MNFKGTLISEFKSGKLQYKHLKQHLSKIEYKIKNIYLKIENYIWEVKKGAVTNSFITQCSLTL